MLKNSSQDVKLHYKMYKDGKRWVFAGLAAVSFFVLAGKPQTIQAATQPAANQVTVTKQGAHEPATSKAQDSQLTAAPVKEQKEPTDKAVAKQAAAMPAPVAVTKSPVAAPAEPQKPTTDNIVTKTDSHKDSSTVAQPAAKANTAATDAAKTKALDQTQPTDTTAKTDAKEAAVQKDTPAKTAVQDPAKPVDDKQPAASTDTKKDDEKDAAKTDSKADPKKTADDDYQTAKDKTDHANDLATKANQSAAALQALLKDPKPDDQDWLTKVNGALADLAKTSNDFTGTKVTTADVVAAYETALKNLPNQPQPSAIAGIKLGDKDETATLANYNKLVDAYTAQVNTILAKVKNGEANYETAQALVAAQKQLKTAADQLNAAIKQAVDSANKGDTAATEHAVTAPDTTGHTLDDYKNAYDDALNSYNSNVTVYNDTTTDPKQKVTPVGTNSDTATPADPTKNPSQKDYDQFKDEVTQAAAQNNAHNHYDTANAAYNKTQTALTGLASTVGAWQTAADNYNKMVTGVNDGTNTQVTKDDLTAGQAAVSKAQTDLATAVKQFSTVNDTYKQALADYQTALNGYAAKAHKDVEPAVPGYGSSDSNSTWNQFQSNITKLQNDFTGTDTTAVPAQNEAIMQQNLAQFQAIQDIGAAARNLQAKVEQINDAAKAQETAVDTWNNLIDQAKTDKRWAFFYPQLHDAGDDLTKKDYAYIDAINGTTTLITSTPDAAEYGKTYHNIQVGKTTVNSAADIAKDATKASYTSVVNAYLKAVNTYNATVTDAKDKLSTGDPTDAAAATKDANNLKNSLKGTNGFSVQYQKLIKTLAGVAADPDQNAQALKTLADPDILSTDGSTTAQRHYTHNRTQSLTEYVILSSSSWNEVLKSVDNNASFSTGLTIYPANATRPAQYTVTDDGVAHQLSEAALKEAFAGPWKDQDWNATDFTVQPTYTDTKDGKTYYLAGYGIFQASNAAGSLNGTTTNQIYTFTSTDAEQEFINNGLKLSGDSSQNGYLFFYYLPETDYSQLVPTPTPTKAATVNGFNTPTTKLAPVISYGTDKAVPAPTVVDGVNANRPTYLTGTTVKPDLQLPGATVQAPTMTLNQPKAPTPPVTPSQPSTPSTPLTPGKPTTPSKPGTPSTPGTPVTPSKPGTPGTAKTPTSDSQTSDHAGNEGGQWSNLTNKSSQAAGAHWSLHNLSTRPGHQSANAAGLATLPQTGERNSTGLMIAGAVLATLSVVFSWMVTDRKRRRD